MRVGTHFEYRCAILRAPLSQTPKKDYIYLYYVRVQIGVFSNNLHFHEQREKTECPHKLCALNARMGIAFSNENHRSDIRLSADRCITRISLKKLHSARGESERVLMRDHDGMPGKDRRWT